MRKQFEKYPFHIFLFVIYFVFFLYTNNKTHLPIHVVFKPIAIAIIFVGLEYLIFLGVTRNSLKAGLLVTLINIPLLNYGIIYDVLEKLYVKGYWPLSNIHRYLIIFSGIYSIGVFYWIIKKYTKHQKLNYVLNLFLMLMIGINVISYFLFDKGKDIKEQAIEMNVNTTRPVPAIDSLPDLYFIVMDGYANQHVLSKYFGYDNSGFMNDLRKLDFYIGDSSLANYYSTLLSLNSTLNMGYNRDLENTQKNLDNNLFFEHLQKKGYRTYSLESGYSVTSTLNNIDSVIHISAPTEFERILLKYTICKLDDLFGFLHHQRLKGQIAKLDEITKISNGPNFFFIHFVAPHPPYVFNEHGEHIFRARSNDRSWEPKPSYVAQMKYFNKVIGEFLNKLVARNKNAAIVLQSDHGPWIKSTDQNEIFEARSMILSAIRFPGGDTSLLHLTKTSVNTFRIFEKNYFKSDIPLLKDSLAGKDFVFKAVLFGNLKEDDTN